MYLTFKTDRIMKRILIVIINVILLSPFFKSSSQNVFSEKNDIIELNATKLKGEIQQNGSQMPFYKKNGWELDNIFPEVTGIPDSLQDVSTHYIFLNLDQAILQAYNAKLIERDAFEKYFKKTNLGSSEYIEDYVKTFVIVISGKSINNERYYVIDTNNDFDFSNEVGYPINLKDQTNQTHKVQFERVMNNKVKKDSTWITLSFLGDEIMFRFDEYTLCKFQFDAFQYEIKLFPSREGIIVNYGSPCFFEISNHTNSTIMERNFDEYIKLNKSDYRITCSEDGNKIKLSKNIDAKKNGSTQHGMSPLSFKTIDLKGHSINFPNDFKNKIVLLDFWATSCSPCIHDIKTTYPKLYNKYGNNKFEIIGIANNTKSELIKFVENNNVNWIIIPDGEKKNIQKLYNIYAFPTLFLINSNGTIIARNIEIRGNNLELLLDELIKFE
jgi:thiol-disulfide isomerase/thioredoxin